MQNVLLCFYVPHWPWPSFLFAFCYSNDFSPLTVFVLCHLFGASLSHYCVFIMLLYLSYVWCISLSGLFSLRHRVCFHLFSANNMTQLYVSTYCTVFACTHVFVFSWRLFMATVKAQCSQCVARHHVRTITGSSSGSLRCLAAPQASRDDRNRSCHTELCFKNNSSHVSNYIHCTVFQKDLQ